ncbi:MAG: DUF2513 domain-containing protein [Caldilineaceae bacterium]|nr:DUF2513 domain-containing protein [Caldilineaceae bacterium]
MERDKDLIVEILKYVREHGDGRRMLVIPDFEQLRSRHHIEKHVIAYHVELCVQAGFLNVSDVGIEMPGTHIREYRIIDLTWDGHEYLEPIKRRSTPRARGVNLHGND